MRSSHFICGASVALALMRPASAAGQQTAPPPALAEAGAANFTIFLRGAPIGSEQIAVTRVPGGWMIASTGRLSAPIDIVARRIEARYSTDWQPLGFSLDAIVRGQAQQIRTTVEGTAAKNDVTTAGQTTQKTDTINPSAILTLPNTFFGPYEALAVRLKDAPAGSDIPVYFVAQGSIAVHVGNSTPEQIQTTSRLVSARRTHITMQLTPPVEADVWMDDASRMIRFSVPGQSLEVVREDIAAVSSRSVTISRPNDETVKIPGNGFTLAGTLSKPTQSAGLRLPAVVLVGGSGQTDRDGLAYGTPVLGEIAGALANDGYLVVRYDKRGAGQSGGRTESASLADYADDARAAVKFLQGRKDVDPKRIAVVGHAEGGLVALLAAEKDKNIAAVGLLATPGMPGADVILAQQQRALNRMTLTPEERQSKVDAQKQIHDAVISGKGLDQLPPEVRRSVDTPEFQSLLTTDPAKVIAKVRQPILVVQGDLDTQVEPQNADRLDAAAKARKNAPAADVVKVPGVNHLMAPAKSGEMSEYGTLPDRHVSAAVTDAIATWLKKTLSTAR
jgi:pimeloyl-ACP methyl ester carboxylesterase